MKQSPNPLFAESILAIERRCDRVGVCTGSEIQQRAGSGRRQGDHRAHSHRLEVDVAVDELGRLACLHDIEINRVVRSGRAVHETVDVRIMLAVDVAEGKTDCVARVERVVGVADVGQARRLADGCRAGGREIAEIEAVIGLAGGFSGERARIINGCLCLYLRYVGLGERCGRNAHREKSRRGNYFLVQDVPPKQCVSRDLCAL